jgi:hypothetical protein
MAWTDGVDYSTGQLISATIWNNYLGAAGNIDLTAPGVVTTAGDLVYATADNTLARLASSGGGNKFLQMNSGATAPSWETALTSLVADTTPQLGGFLDANGQYIQMQKGGDISSASPTVIDTDGDYFICTGTTSFSALTVAADRHFFLEFAGALTITHGAGTIDLPGGANITTAAGDVAEFVSTAANVVTCVNYTKADGTAVVAESGGITHASQWRLTTDFTGDAAPIASNLEEVDAPVGFGVLGSSMTESSGVFTFPSTGYWWIKFQAAWFHTAVSEYCDAAIWTTTNNSTYAKAAYGSNGTAASGTASQYGNPSAEYIFDVTSTSNNKCQFRVYTADDSATVKGSTSFNYTYMTFIRLGDT